MKCSYLDCKGRIYTTYPPNELCSCTHHFCYYHYQILMGCTKEDLRKFYIKNCAMVVNTKSSKEEDIK